MNFAIVHVCQPAEGMWFTLHWPPVSHRQKLASLVLMGCRAEKERGGENVVGGLLMGVWGFRRYVHMCVSVCMCP